MFVSLDMFGDAVWGVNSWKLKPKKNHVSGCPSRHFVIAAYVLKLTHQEAAPTRPAIRCGTRYEGRHIEFYSRNALFPRQVYCTTVRRKHGQRTSFCASSPFSRSWPADDGSGHAAEHTCPSASGTCCQRIRHTHWAWPPPPTCLGYCRRPCSLLIWRLNSNVYTTHHTWYTVR